MSHPHEHTHGPWEDCRISMKRDSLRLCTQLQLRLALTGDCDVHVYVSRTAAISLIR